MIGRGSGAALAAGLLALAACAPAPPADPAGAALARLARATDPVPERVTLEMPFARGPLDVVVDEGTGEIETYRLVACQGRQAVCLGNAQGPAGQVRATRDWFVVAGLGGRTFWLDGGGEGYAEAGGRFFPLAWNAVANGTGDGSAASLESTASHGPRDTLRREP